MINLKLVDEVFLYLKEVEKSVKSSTKINDFLLSKGFDLAGKIEKIKPKNLPEENILYQLQVLCQCGAELSQYRIKEDDN